MDMNKLREAASRLWNAETLPALKTFVSRESLSTDFDPEWEKHGILTEVCREAAAWGAGCFRAAHTTYSRNPAAHRP